MRKLLLTMLVLGLAGPGTGRGEIERGEVPALFRQANTLYEQGDYSRAADGYRKILDGGWKSAAVYYNLGNAYFKQDQLGPAILYYRKAENLAPRDPEITKNLEYAREALRDDITALPPSFWKRTRQSVSGWLSPGEWIALSAALYFLTLIWLVAALVIPSLKKVSPPILKTLLPALAVSAALTLLALSYYRTPRAIVLADEVSVRYGPQESDAAAFKLHEGTEVRVVRKRNGWLQVALPDGTSGWMPADSVGMI